MPFTCIYEGMIISEGRLDRSQSLGMIEVDLGSKFGAHLKSLNDVKAELTAKARVLGANAIENFTYGQKQRWFAIDNVSFWGKGIAVRIPEDVVDTYLNK